ncbi:hypothetical protein [Salipiger bermudensis]|nr:hypothetical protein [Salipiger bermudensis]
MPSILKRLAALYRAPTRCGALCREVAEETALIARDAARNA